MTELRPAVEVNQQPLDDQIAAVFDRRAGDIRRDRKLILDTYEQKFQDLVETLPPENQNTVMVKLQKIGITVRGIFSEYGARITDFVRNVVVWPMVKATPDFPRDKYYQIQLARAKAWTGFARDTIRTATAERTAYRDHFLPSAVIGAEYGTLFGIGWGIPLGIAAGAAKGAGVGLAAGVVGVAAGAGIGALVGGGSALIIRLKDRMIGPPVVYYNLDSHSGVTHSGSGSGVSSTFSGGGIDAGADVSSA